VEKLITRFRKIATTAIGTSATLAVGLFLTVGLVTFDPADAPGTGVYPPNAVAANWCGSAGAHVAYAVFWAIGDGAYILIFFVLASTILWFTKLSFENIAFRIFGALLLLVSVSLISSMLTDWLPADWYPSRMEVGNGGVLGLATWQCLEPRLAKVGVCLLLAPVLLVGLLLLTDTWFILLPWLAFCWLRDHVGGPSRRVAGLAVAGATAAGAAGARLIGGAAEEEPKPAVRKQRKANADEEEKDQEEGGDEEPGADAKPKRGRAKTLVADEEDDEPPVDESQARRSAKGRAEKSDDAEDEGAAAPPALPRNVIIRTNRPTPKEEAEDEDFAFTPLASTPHNQEYKLPPVDLLENAEYTEDADQEDYVRSQAEVLTKTLAEFGVQATVVAVETGPVITQYELALAPGIKVGKVIGLSDDLAISMKAASVRIVAPLPGKDTIGVEVPNLKRQIVKLKEIVLGAKEAATRMGLPLFIGKDATGQPLVKDLATMPHLLIAGTTGSGKSVCLNTIIMALLLTRTPDDLKLVLIDPKMVEMTVFNTLPHLLCPVVNDMRRAEAILGWLVDKMDERYVTLSRAGVRNIAAFNRLTREEIVAKFKPATPEDEAKLPYHLPHICVIVDELADLMMVAAKEVEMHVTRLAQKSRAVGIHLVMATQRPSVDVLTGLIKANLPIRISFQVTTRVDSRTILDSMGAEKLLGQGDMLLMSPGASKFVRGQGAFVSDQDIAKVLEFVTKDAEPSFQRELIQLKVESDEDAPPGEDESLLAFGADDPTYNQSIEVVLEHQRGSVSLLQRRLGIGYGRAARLIDQMAADGIVGEYKGSQAREVLLTLEQWQALKQQRRVDENPKDTAMTDDEANLDT
jgi:S-DNA-T family DNA segregation ATPase FtsK/SpoIIIE